MNFTNVMSGPPRGDGKATLDPRQQAAYLLHEWRLMFRTRTILADTLAAVAVALVALPLSLAISNASGVSPGVGLITAVMGGVVAALLGGCRLQVSGPAAAMTFLVLEVVTVHGMRGLIAATLMAGMIQMLAGVFRLGRFMNYIPRPVIAGFLSGIGLTILCTQAPVILGYEVLHSNEEGGAVALLWKTLRQVGQTDPQSLAVGLTAMVLMIALPRISRRLPTPLLAVGIASLLPWVMGWSGVVMLGSIPSAFPRPTVPIIPWGEWNELVMAALTIALLASIESLLSASVVDSMSKTSRVDNDQELFGQGTANMASALFGGIPVTGVIARSATNIQAGAKTRLSALLHALIILAVILWLSPLGTLIPKAALAGVLAAVALRMVELHVLSKLWRGSRAEAIVFVVTAGAIVVTDLIDGVQVGMLATVFYFVYEMSSLSVRPIALSHEPGQGLGDEAGGNGERCQLVMVMEVEGPLFFASSYHLRQILNRLDGYRCVVLDMAGMPFLDVTGAEVLEEGILLLKKKGSDVLLARPTDSVRERLRSLARSQFHAILECPVYDGLSDAMLHAATLVEPDHLCLQCRDQGRCMALDRALKGAETTGRTPVPRVRAVVSAGDALDWDVKDTRSPEGQGTPLSSIPLESIRPSPTTSWDSRNQRPTIHPTAFVDPHASVIGAATVGERVYIGPGVSVRADEGTPFYIGEESNLQDGVTLHALKGKVILVGGRPFAIYVGRNVCLTHHALVHGPCFIGDRCFIGFKSVVHDAVVGEGCVLGLGAIVVGVSLPPRRYVGHNVLVDTQEKADALPPVDPSWERFRDEVVEVNQELAAGHRQALHGVVAGTEATADPAQREGRQA